MTKGEGGKCWAGRGGGGGCGGGRDTILHDAATTVEPLYKDT